MLTPGEIDGRMEQYVYNVMVRLEDGTFHMWYTAMFDEQYQKFAPKSSGIVYAQSKDGTNWVKDSKPVFYTGPADALWMYYSCGHLIETNDDPRRFRTSLAIHRFGE